jgi:hypothetical protein
LIRYKFIGNFYCLRLEPVQPEKVLGFRGEHLAHNGVIIDKLFLDLITIFYARLPGYTYLGLLFQFGSDHLDLRVVFHFDYLAGVAEGEKYRLSS